MGACAGSCVGSRWPQFPPVLQQPSPENSLHSSRSQVLTREVKGLRLQGGRWSVYCPSWECGGQAGRKEARARRPRPETPWDETPRTCEESFTIVGDAPPTLGPVAQRVTRLTAGPARGRPGGALCDLPSTCISKAFRKPLVTRLVLSRHSAQLRGRVGEAAKGAHSDRECLPSVRLQENVSARLCIDAFLRVNSVLAHPAAFPRLLGPRPPGDPPQRLPQQRGEKLARQRPRARGRVGCKGTTSEETPLCRAGPAQGAPDRVDLEPSR